eukprot:TRINITY_DN16021_c0_g1_i1.p1 TRINITY_DN16021_c0_g1~~TRINITY_DN16021_c0_g1_i1.p1  ORF type:complete len:114 (-),score=51.81 TRINITY_DN16021_c0_g1_i1:109-411(-)
MSLRQSTVMLRRCFSVNTPAAAAAADPIQNLFVEKIREYGDKKAKAGGKLVDANKATEADLQAELDKVAKSYGGGAGVDMTSFPEFKFTDPVVDPINISQ